jgi:hypothetical protein
MQHCSSPLRDFYAEPLAVRGTCLDRSCAAPVRGFTITAPSSEQGGAGVEVGGSGCGTDRLRLLEELLCDAELTAEDLKRGEVVDYERQTGQTAALAGNPTRFPRNLFGRLVVPGVERELAGETKRSEVSAVHPFGTKRCKRARHQWQSRLIPLRHARDDARKQQIDSAGRLEP